MPPPTRVAPLAAAVLLLAAVAAPAPAATLAVGSGTPGGLTVHVDPDTGLPANLTAGRADGPAWLRAPVGLRVRNEVTNTEAAPAAATVARHTDSSLELTAALPGLDLTLSQAWTALPNGLRWDLTLTGPGPRAGHEVVLDWPLLAPGLSVFTPSELGTMALQAYPTYRPVAYGANGWGDGSAYVLPLVSVFDPEHDGALTLALPADGPIPHLQVDWRDAAVLRLTLAHRAMGGDRPASLRLLLYAHPADYRAALGAYAADFPAYFRPPLPRGPYEGTFWYHHIQDRPEFDELARQHVRYLWASFWFTYLGEYLPDTPEWAPYTFAKWWSLGKRVSDEQIRVFTRSLHENGIGLFAYFNVTEYGGAGGEQGDPAAAAARLREQFAAALLKDAAGQPVPTWEGAMAVNPGAAYPLWPVLEDQVRRHLQRLPEIDGFVIDRLDWASQIDYGHDDGTTMVGARPVENMAGPVAAAVQAVCRLAHAAGKRVFVNQFYRVEVLRDTDGVCHENDFLPALGYLTPLRPASAWHMRVGYQGDLLPFEAQLKRRLHWALSPQMIAHQFPISQQVPNPHAADLLEVYAPLFETLMGKEQVLEPSCVTVTGANDANLFRTGPARWVVPVTSRLGFLARPTRSTERVTLSLRMAGANGLRWAQARTAEGLVQRATVERQADGARITVDGHASASMVIVGSDDEPALPAADPTPVAARLASLFGPPEPPSQSMPQPTPGTVQRLDLLMRATQLGSAGVAEAWVDDHRLGALSAAPGRFALPLATPDRLPAAPPEVSLRTFDDGTWYRPQQVDLLAHTADGQVWRVARWTPAMGCAVRSTARNLRLRPAWCEPQRLAGTAVKSDGRAPDTGGDWSGRYGHTAAWIAEATAANVPQNGYRLQVANAQTCVWKTDARDDRRVLRNPAGAAAPTPATCWHHTDRFTLALEPPDAKPYRLTVYLLDFDRHGRAMRLTAEDEAGALDTQDVSAAESLAGVYLSWQAAGPLTVTVAKQVGYNAVVSAVLVDAGE